MDTDILELSKEEKEDAFDRLADMFYDRNFGTASKADIETLMFAIYMQGLIRKYSDDEGVLDYSVCSDYKIGRQLGITPQRVSTLKVRMEQRYPQDDFDWKKSFKRLVSDGRNVHVSGGNIRINIPDPNLFLAISDYIEDHSGIVDIQLNRKVLSVSQHDFISLLAVFADEGERKEICRAVNKAAKAEGRENFISETADIEKISAAVGAVSDVAGIAQIITDSVNPGLWIAKAILALVGT